MKFGLFFLGVLGAVSGASLVFQSSTSDTGYLAPLYLAPLTEKSTPIEDSYIVVLKSDNSAKSDATLRLMRHQEWLLRTIEHHSVAEFNSTLFDSRVANVFDFQDFQGYAGAFTPSVLNAIRANPDVMFIEQDRFISIDKAIAVQPTSAFVEHNATWGLQRISQVSSIAQGKPDSLIFDYFYDEDAQGEGVDVYIVDTGININHEEFKGRAVWGTTTASMARNKDGNGHGTHVAGIVGGKRFGVAKKVNLIAVKVMNDKGQGAISWIVAGIQWTIRSHQSKANAKSVANLSIGGGSSPSLDRAVDAAVDAGVVVAVAAGNEDADACYFSPAAAKKPITVAASTIDDTRAYFSNYGSCVDIFAPGHQIIASWFSGVQDYRMLSGTSMASPFVAGFAATIASKMPVGVKAEKVKDAILSCANKHKIRALKGSPNLLLNNAVAKA